MPTIAVPLLMAIVAGAPPVRAAVLKTITIDGSMADWAAVLADPFQRSDDGPAGGMADADAPVQSTGRDLLTFAWTYDTSYLYLYTQRLDGSSNRQEFFFYVDTDADGVMEAGEPVVGVSWWGRTGRTDVQIYSYLPAAGGGDPMGDPGGIADGWDMPGTILWRAFLESTLGGAPNGVEMEARVTWAALGVPAGSVVFFHVASSNSSNVPSQQDDNMGGPGGLVGTTQFPGVSITPDRVATIAPGGDAVLAHVVTNTSAMTDTIDLEWSSAGGFIPSAVVFYGDANGDGRLDAGDVALADNTGNGAPDTGALAAGSSMEILVVTTAPASATAGQQATVTIRASLSAIPAATDTAVDALTVASPNMTLVKSVDTVAVAPGDVITYTVSWTSDGTADSHSVVLVDTVPPPTVYVPGSAAGPGAAIAFSHDGGVTFDASESLPVTNIRWTFASPLPPGATGAVSFKVIVP